MHQYGTLSDRELTELLKLNDREAFTEIYSRYWKKLFTIAANKLKDNDDAEEIVQDIFVSLWARRAGLCITNALSAYLAVSVKYRVIKTIDKRVRVQSFADINDELSSLLDNSTEEWLQFEELRTKLSEFVAELPAKCQLVFKLSRESGFSQKKIAEELDISEKTVEAHLGKALRTLRVRMKHFLL